MGSGFKKIAVRALVVLFTQNDKKLDKQELSELNERYFDIKSQMRPGNFIWYVSHAFVENVIVSDEVAKSKHIAFLAFGKE